MVVKAKRDSLLKIVNTNRDAHKKVFEEAWEGYRKAIIAELEKALEDARKGIRIFRQTTLVQPINQTREYDRAIRMLELTTDDVIVLEEHQFSELVMDQWSWGRQFATTNRAYVTGATGPVGLAGPSGPAVAWASAAEYLDHIMENG